MLLKKMQIFNYTHLKETNKFRLLQDFHENYATEAFKKFDKDGSGFISAMDFQDVMLSIKSHLLTKDVKDNLVAVSILSFRFQSNSLLHLFNKI